MEATVAATFSQQRPRFHKLERPAHGWWHTTIIMTSVYPACTSLRRFWRFCIFCLNAE
jgi:hypothetical protein